MKLFYSLILIILFVSAGFSQNTVSPAAPEKAKLLVLWAEKDCKACTYMMIDGQQFRVIDDGNVYLAFHAGIDEDYFISDIYLLNKSNASFSFNPQTNIVVSTWKTEKSFSPGAQADENFKSLPPEKIAVKKARPEFWNTALRLFGNQLLVKPSPANVTESNTPFLEASMLSPNSAVYGTVYYPKKRNFDAIAFNVSVNDKIYTFSYRNPQLTK